MKIRRAFPEDSAEAQKLFKRTFFTLMTPAYGKEALAAALPFLTKPNLRLLSSGTYYVAEEDSGRLLAAGGWTLECPDTKEIIPGTAHLRHFATDPDVARRGVGRAIFRECALNAEKAGTKVFQAFSSLNAVAFYRVLGLLPVRQIDLKFNSVVSLPAVLMQGPVRTE